MDSENSKDDVAENKEVKLDIKNIALKAPKRGKTGHSDGFWRMFWIGNIPKREGISDIRKEYSQVMENMAQS